MPSVCLIRDFILAVNPLSIGWSNQNGASAGVYDCTTNSFHPGDFDAKCV